jgi:hypothetical protein
VGVCKLGVCNICVFVCVGFIMCGCVYVRVCNAWLCECVGIRGIGVQ